MQLVLINEGEGEQGEQGEPDAFNDSAGAGGAGKHKGSRLERS